MPRAPKNKIKKEEDTVFKMIVGVTVATLLVGAYLFFFEPILGVSPTATANVEISNTTPSPEVSEPVFFDDKMALTDIDPSDPMPQCNFQTNVQNIIYGQPVTFLWDCANADRCSLDGIGNVSTVKRGSIEMAPRRSAKYQLVCSNQEGSRSFDADIGVFEFSLREVNANEQ